jgi:hypothetical protein
MPGRDSGSQQFHLVRVSHRVQFEDIPVTIWSASAHQRQNSNQKREKAYVIN